MVGWSSNKQHTLQQFSLFPVVTVAEQVSIIEKYKILLCTVRISITYCVSFPAAKEKRAAFGIKASGRKATE